MTTTLFDIAADLDTPVSAYLKLKPFRPRFLLESVEGGERLARYSFIGFGDCMEYRLDASGPDREWRARTPADRSGPTAGLPAAGPRAFTAARRDPGRFPAAGRPGRRSELRPGALFRTAAVEGPGRSGRAGRALRRAAFGPGVRPPHAPCGVAARGPGAGTAGVASRSDPGPAGRVAGTGPCDEVRAGRGQPVRRVFPAERRPHQGIHRVRRRVPARAVRVFRRPLRHGPVRSVPGAALAESFALHVLLRTRRPRHRRLVARGAGEARRRRCAPASDRRHVAARRRHDAGPRE